VNLKRIFLVAFIVAFAVAAFLAIGVILFSQWNDLELKLLITTISIGGYSLIALGCATVYDNESLRPLAVAGIATCAIGLTFALLTNWQIIEPGLKILLKCRFGFLSLSMAFAATALMLRTELASSIVQLSQRLTIFFIWLTTLLFDFILFLLAGSPGDKSGGVVRATAASSIVALLGLVVTPILQRVCRPD